MNANTTTFGIEIECCLPVALRSSVAVGGYHRGMQIAALPPGWTAQTDGSICAPVGFFAVEVVSPVLVGADGVRQVVAVLEWLRGQGARVNQSTGLHVHVGWAGDEAALIRLATMCSNHEKAFYAATGTKTRERNSYCRPVRNNGDMVRAFRQTGDCRQSDRYCLLNTTNLQRRQPTVEFRAFAGTLNTHKVLGYIQICVGVVNKALAAKRVIKWDSKTVAQSSPVRKGGEGATELNRLFFALGWNKGRVPTVWGEIDRPVGAPTRESCQKKLAEMAKKYDEQV